MSGKSNFNNVNNGVDRIIQRSNEIDEILKLKRQDQRLYILDVLYKRGRSRALVRKLKEIKSNVEKENQSLRKQNVDLQAELKRIEALEVAQKKTEEENENLKKQNDDLRTKSVKVEVLFETNRALRSQLEKFYDLFAWLSIAFIVADGLIDLVSTDWGALSDVKRCLFVFELVLRGFGAAAIWVCILWTKPSNHNDGRRVETNSCEGVFQQTENLL